MQVPYRVRQAIYYATADRKAPPVLLADARALLNDAMLPQFRALPAGDQQHVLRVYRYLVTHGAEPDTQVAGLLHDVGKACRNCRTTLFDRTAHVLLRKFVPGAYRRFALMEHPPAALKNLHRLASHPQRGARAASLAGYRERVAQLIVDHEDGGDPADVQLQLLRQADTHADASHNRDRT